MGGVAEYSSNFLLLTGMLLSQERRKLPPSRLVYLRTMSYVKLEEFKYVLASDKSVCLWFWSFLPPIINRWLL